MGLGDLTQALASVAVLEKRDPIDVERPAADMPAFQPGAAHTCPHPLDDQIALEFGDGPMMMTTARPSGPPVSRFSRKLRNSILR